jgi:hypothetical protein
LRLYLKTPGFPVNKLDVAEVRVDEVQTEVEYAIEHRPNVGARFKESGKPRLHRT